MSSGTPANRRAKHRGVAPPQQKLEGAGAGGVRLCGGLGLEVRHRIADALQLVGVLVRDVDPEGLFQLHHQLDDVERVRTEVLDELGLRRELLHVDFELLRDDLLDPVFAERFHDLHLLWVGVLGFLIQAMTMPPSTVITCPVM